MGIGGKERQGRDDDPLLPSSVAGHERVELYLYSPYGQHDLYRASVTVQGCTLPFTFYRNCEDSVYGEYRFQIHKLAFCWTSVSIDYYLQLT